MWSWLHFETLGVYIGIQSLSASLKSQFLQGITGVSMLYMYNKLNPAFSELSVCIITIKLVTLYPIPKEHNLIE